MIIHLNANLSQQEVEQIAENISAVHFKDSDHYTLVTSSKQKPSLSSFQDQVIETFEFDTDLQLASRKYIHSTRAVNLGNVTIGGDTSHTVMITGPCAVESEQQIKAVSEFCKTEGVQVLRGGCFKPRTSPYTFQGLGQQGLEILANARSEYGFNIITEVKDATHVNAVIEQSDIIQIGAKSMYDHGILTACSKITKPVLIKRGFGTTLQEFVQAAEFVLSGGNPNVMLCERGIRTFESKTRFTLDLCGVAFLKEHTNLPIIVDPSHAMGYRYGIADLTRAAVAMGVDGLLIETHPTPNTALSDAAQQLSFDEFSALNQSLSAVASAVGRKMV